ncbi:hypothetical protein ACHAWF_014253 [Thalassiosira exigua]
MRRLAAGKKLSVAALLAIAPPSLSLSLSRGLIMPRCSLMTPIGRLGLALRPPAPDRRGRYLMRSASCLGRPLWGASDVQSGRIARRPCRRAYQMSAASAPNRDDRDADDAVDVEAADRRNTLSRRLYRTLLRSCRRDVELSNRGNVLQTMKNGDAHLDGDDRRWILLQPPMDPRKYGFAKIVRARRGNRREFAPPARAGRSRVKNRAARKMSEDEVGAAMEVLRFLNLSLGGYPGDDLEEYYLRTEEEGPEESVAGDSATATPTAVAGRHSEGHYTQFLDEDEERGEGADEEASEGRGDGVGEEDGEGAGGGEEHRAEENDEEEEEYVDYPEDEWDSDDEADRGADVDESVLVTSDDLRNAVRIAFRAPLVPPEEMTASTAVALRHRDAIAACARLSEQLGRWGGRSSVSVDWERGVRVVTTSGLLARPSSPTGKYRHSYRIRVENIFDLADGADEGGAEGEEGRPRGEQGVQFLGRTWIISEQGPWHTTSPSALRRLLEEGAISSVGNDDREHVGRGDELRVAQTVNEPRTGAVGHLPVLAPGEVFEYMSGAEIATTRGAMEGAFHMASVDTHTTPSASIGDEVDALRWKSNDERRFEMPIGRFGLVADEDANN